MGRVPGDIESETLGKKRLAGDIDSEVRGKKRVPSDIDSETRGKKRALVAGDEKISPRSAPQTGSSLPEKWVTTEKFEVGGSILQEQPPYLRLETQKEQPHQLPNADDNRWTPEFEPGQNGKKMKHYYLERSLKGASSESDKGGNAWKVSGILMGKEMPKFTASVSLGWQSADVYKHIDKTSEAGLPKAGDPTRDDVHRTSVWYAKATGVFDGVFGGKLGIGVTYLQSSDRLYPRVASINSLTNGESLSRQTFYNEVDLAIAYTHAIIPKKMEATVGYNAFVVPDRGFWGTNYSGELYANLAWIGIPYFRPNVTYSHFHSGAVQLRKGYLDFNLDTVGIPLCRRDSIQIDFNPYVSIGIDNGLIMENTDWAAVDIGVRVPILFKDRFVLTLNGNYGIPINGNPSSNNFRTDLGKVGFWGGAAITFKF